MNPIGTMIELLVIGIQTITGVYFFVSALAAFKVISPLPVSGDSLGGGLILIIVSAWAYTFAILVDRLADDLQDLIARNEKKPRDKSNARVTWYGWLKNAPKEDSKFRNTFYQVAKLRIPELDRTIAYYRSRVRISRATRLTVPLTVLSAAAWMLAYKPFIFAVAVTIAGTGVTIICWRVASVMYLKYNSLVRGIQKSFNLSLKDPTHQ